MEQIIEQAQKLYPLEDCIFTTVSGNAGGRNRIVIVSHDGEKQYVLRISTLGDRSENDYLAETEFVHFCHIFDSTCANCFSSVHSLPGSSVDRILQGRILEWLAMPYSRGSSRIE